MNRARITMLLTAAALMLMACPPPPPVQASPAPQTPQAIAAAKTIFYDNFTSVKPEWQQVGGIWERYTAQEGRLEQQSNDDSHLNAIYYIPTPRVADATIETSVAITGLANRPTAITSDEADRQMVRNIRYIIGAGIVFRMRDAKNFYMFRLAGEEGAVLGKMVDGVWVDIANPRVRDMSKGARIGFRPDNWYRLKVDVYGNRIVCSINDEAVINRTDDTFETGQFGLTTFKTEAAFDYIKVTNRNETEVKTQ